MVRRSPLARGAQVGWGESWSRLTSLYLFVPTALGSLLLISLELRQLFTDGIDIYFDSVWKYIDITSYTFQIVAMVRATSHPPREMCGSCVAAGETPPS